jgi:hypothetical protein
MNTERLTDQEAAALLPGLTAEQIDAATLARCLGVSPKVVYDLTKLGVLERGAGRMFAIEGSVRRYCEWLRGQADGSEHGAGSRMNKRRENPWHN